MGRCLLGVLVLTAGLMALATAAREISSPVSESMPETTATSGNRLRGWEVVAVSGTARTLLVPAPARDLRFSLN
jgi:hypothetical protein